MIEHRKRFFSTALMAVALGLGLASGGLHSQSPEPAAAPDTQADQTPVVYRVEISGAITPSAMENLSQAIETAEQANAAALLVVMDTPGGLVSSMDNMIREILSSRVPVITYVGPPGAACGSAGVYLMYASHIAAMAPATNIGSATPVQIGGGSPAPQGPSGPGGPQNEPGQQPQQTPAPAGDRIPETAGADDTLNMKRKLLNHSRAQMRTLAEYHGRNKDFAVRSITHAENITASEALNRGAINLVAETEAELLRRIDGQSVRMSDGRRVLDLKDARVETIEADFRRRILNFLANPNVAMIFMMLGIAGIFAEIYHPGAIFPGAIGAIFLVLGLYAMQSLSVDYTGLALIGLGIAFFILEFNVMSYGLLSIGGTLCMTLGALMMFRSGGAFVGASLALFIFSTLITGGLMGGIVYMAAKSHRKPVVSGQEQMLDSIGVTESEVTPNSGRIYIHSEIWQARTRGESIPENQRVRVVGINGLVLLVEGVSPA
ncbi:MAG: nodulation protein NfeD [bacterium]|nr:nodulation protein NfeD [bacterium]